MAYNETPYERITAMISTYSYLGTTLHLSLHDDVADAFNRVQDAIFGAQTRIFLTTGVRWTPVHELDLKLNSDDESAYVSVLNYATATIETKRISLDELTPQIKTTHLIKV